MSKRAATAILLAGGQSKRMGTDKARLPWAGTTLLQHIHAQLSAQFDEVLLASGTPDRYADLGLLGLADSPLAEGPMAGIIVGIEAARHDLVYLHPCDSPEISPTLLDALFGALIDTCDGVVSVTSKFAQPLHGLYRRAPLEEALNAAAASRAFGIIRATAAMNLATVECSAFSNLNSPGDLAAREITSPLSREIR